MIANEIEEFRPSLAERDRWLVLNKVDQLLECEREERKQAVIKQLGWTGPVFMISALDGEGTKELAQAMMRYLEERDLRISEDKDYAEYLIDLDQRIEEEGRARLQELDDQRALRRAGVKAATDVDEDDFDDDEEDDEDGAEIIYVNH